MGRYRRTAAFSCLYLIEQMGGWRWTWRISFFFPLSRAFRTGSPAGTIANRNILRHEAIYVNGILHAQLLRQGKVSGSYLTRINFLFSMNAGAFILQK